jgi:tetratricopeptide (TPR) repeat protein
MALPQEATTGAGPTPLEGEVTARRAAFRAENTRATRDALISALLALAEAEVARGHEAATVSALAEASSLFPQRLPEDPAWQGRFVMLNRAKAALAQRQDRHGDAVDAFKAALSAIPAEPAIAGRDGNAARLQLLVRLARSRLALGEAADVESDMRECDVLMAELEGKIPARAIDTIRAAVLGNAGVAQAILGKLQTAEAKLSESIAIIDRLNSPELADLRRQVLSAWTDVLRRGGGDATALFARMAPTEHAHDESCGCGEPHHHDQNASHEHHDHRHPPFGRPARRR